MAAAVAAAPHVEDCENEDDSIDDISDEQEENVDDAEDEAEDTDEDDNDADEDDDEADEDDADEDDDDGRHEGDGKLHGKDGMADVITKILGKPLPEGKSTVLAKYKSSRKRELKEEQDKKKSSAEAKAAKLEKNHVIPTRSHADKEVRLRKIATRGVVKLFNAVSKHQEDSKSKLKDAKTEVKKDRALDGMSKSSFLDLLKSTSSKKTGRGKDNAAETLAKSGEEDEKPAWRILRDDYMLGAKMKDWNKDDVDGEDEDDKDEQVADQGSTGSDSE